MCIRDSSTLLWDLDGTLYDFEKNQERSLRRVLEEFGVDASEENVACYLRINHQLWSDYEQGLIGKQVIEDTRFQRTFDEPVSYTHLDVYMRQEYHLGEEANVILSTGSWETGGFIVYRKGLLEGSLLQPILDEHPKLAQFQLPAGMFVRHKGRQYCCCLLYTSRCV